MSSYLNNLLFNPPFCITFSTIKRRHRLLPPIFYFLKPFSTSSSCFTCTPSVLILRNPSTILNLLSSVTFNLCPIFDLQTISTLSLFHTFLSSSFLLLFLMLLYSWRFCLLLATMLQLVSVFIFLGCWVVFFRSLLLRSSSCTLLWIFHGLDRFQHRRYPSFVWWLQSVSFHRCQSNFLLSLSSLSLFFVQCLSCSPFFPLL